MTRTYNPILERTDVPRRLFRSSKFAPELGTAVVLVRRTAEPIVVWHGQRMPPTKLGEHRRYVVDTASRGIGFEMRAASADPVFPFAVTVEVACRVLNPYTIARDNIQDMTAALMPSLAREVRDTAARFDVLRPTEAARAIELRLSTAQPSGDVELSGYSVMVEPENTQGVVEAKQELGVQRLRRDELREVSHGSPEEQIAQLLAINNGDVREVLSYFATQHNDDAAIKLQALRIAMGGNLEDMDVADVQRSAFSNIFGNGNGGKRETMRERIERRKTGLDAPKVLEGGSGAHKDAAAPAGQPAAKPAGNGVGATPSDGA